MEPLSRPERRSRAVIEQLNAEIAASKYRNVKALTTAMDVNYINFLRYTTGEREIPMRVLFAVLDQLELRPEDFFRRAEDRF